MGDSISRQDAIDTALWFIVEYLGGAFDEDLQKLLLERMLALHSAEPEDYTDLKKEFIRMASYIDTLLICPDEQKANLVDMISKIAEYMPWTERD